MKTPAPAFDQQSARAVLYALLNDGPVWGIGASFEERTQADGSIAYVPAIHDFGVLSWTGRPIWTGTDATEAPMAKQVAIDIARSRACDLILNSLEISSNWPETLRRFRRAPTDATTNPITKEKQP